MENTLAVALFNKGVLKPGTEVRATHKAMGLGSVVNVLVVSDFSIAAVIIREDGKAEFSLRNLRDGGASTVTSEAIHDIDGMDPVRFADVYNVTPTGTAAVLGKRRGRKPKNRQIEQV